jgi:hypothetical protein
MRLFAVTIMIVCLTAAGCVTVDGGEGRSSRSASLITRAEIEESGSSTVHELIQKLRPGWLIDRGTRSFDPAGGMSAGIQVYMGETRLGGVDVLSQISVGGVESLRFLSATEAANRLPGLGAGQHATGAIVITTRSEP